MTTTSNSRTRFTPVNTARGAIAGFLHRAAGDRRDDRVVDGVCSLATPASSVLDVGCSDGRIARRIATQLGVSDVRGADVQLQPGAQIDVTEYDGSNLPFPDNSFDLVTIVDVLHHADDPTAVLRDSLRVARPEGRVIVKDHVRLSWWSDRVLYAMDVASNFGVHTRATGNYLAPDEWVNTVTTAGGHIERMVWPFRIHGLPWSLVARSKYHLLLRIRRASVAA